MQQLLNLAMVMNIKCTNALQHMVTDQRRGANLGLGEGVGPDAVPSGRRRAVAFINLKNNTDTKTT